MSHLVVEILLRLSKTLMAAILGALAYGVLVGPLGAVGSPELALLAFLSGAVVVLLAESSPI